MKHFRPNIVVDGCGAFEEDTWQRVRVGDCEFELA
ncbi:MAG: MOSC domain-containing protein [Anaerolineales bacterium]